MWSPDKDGNEKAQHGDTRPGFRASGGDVETPYPERSDVSSVLAQARI